MPEAPAPFSDPPVSDPPVSAVIILAAGEGTRMRSARPKVLHEVAGHSLLSWVLAAANAVEPEHVVVVVGHGREQVEAHLAEVAPHVTTVVQGGDAYGSGYATRCALEALPDLTGDVLVTVSDVPLLAGETLRSLVAEHRQRAAGATILSATVPDPTGYGRIWRDANGAVLGIVEHRDADAEQRAVAEINSGIYAFDADTLRTGLSQLSADNAQGELMLTDVIAGARTGGRTVGAHRIEDHWQTEGVNDRVQLSRLNGELNRRVLNRWMRAGVSVVDPDRTWVHASVDLAADVTLLPGTSLEGATSVAAGATLGPEVTLVDCEVGAGATVLRSHAVLSVIGAGATVGPYASLRAGTVLGDGAKVGTFVETKNAQIGPGAKVPHQTYVGDATIAEGANVGAGVIFANYDGVTKSHTDVGRFAFVGSNTTLVAPLSVADGTYVAAGSVITGDVDPGDLAVARGQQRNVAGWVARKRAGTQTAAAAREANTSRERT